MKRTIGGDRVGSGNKMTVDLHGYDRSTHDLGRVWRSSMSVGTLVPFMTEIGLPADTFDIDLNTMVRTMPTNGPLFGSFKMQLDVYQIPIRLFIRDLHNNKLGIGMDMRKVKFPLVEMRSQPIRASMVEPETLQQINPSALMHYLGVSGLGFQNNGNQYDYLIRKVNAVPMLAYYEIFKNYYSNKQEPTAYIIGGRRDNDAYDYAPIRVKSGNTIWDAPTYNNGEAKLLEGNTIELTFDQEEVKLLGVRKLIDNLFVTIDEGGLGKTESFEKIFNVNEISGQTAYCTTRSGTTLKWIALESQLFGQKPDLVPFQLDQIDQMRQTLLSNETVTIGEFSGAPYTAVTGYDPVTYKSNQYITQSGLCLKTYQSDMFNNWLNTEWIDGVNGVSELSAVDVSGGLLKMDALNLAQKVYNMLNRIAVSGGTYNDYIEVIWGSEVMRLAESPIYEGGLSTEIVFDEVVSTANTETSSTEEPLGSLAGRGTQNGKQKGGRITIRVNEPCVIMGIASITPRIDYSQGIKWWNNLLTIDDLHKPALDGIGYQELMTDQMHFMESWIDDQPSSQPITRFSAGKQPAWLNYMTSHNEVHGDFADQNKTMFMTLNRNYETMGGRIQDLTTYIDPTKYNYAFANAAIDAQNFWVQIGVDITARRKISAKQIPNL